MRICWVHEHSTPRDSPHAQWLGQLVVQGNMGFACSDSFRSSPGGESWMALMSYQKAAFLAC